MSHIWTQLFPGKPHYSEENVPSLEGKVFVVTGAYGGIGSLLSGILYRAGGKVYFAGRSQEKIEHGIAKIVEDSKGIQERCGSLVPLVLDMSDLSAVRVAAKGLIKNEQRIDILYNNAGLVSPPLDPKSAQGYDMSLATNVLGPLLLAILLLPALRSGKDQPHSRIIWPASIYVDNVAPTGGLDIELDLRQAHQNQDRRYVTSKVCNWFFASELARREGTNGIISLAVNPGTLSTGWDRYQPYFIRFMCWPISSPAINGVGTYLWASFSQDVTVADNGRYIIPWGRWHPQPRQDILPSLKPLEEGGTGLARDVWNWCDRELSTYLTQ